MTFHYLDSSVWAKRHFEETGSDAVHQMFRSAPIAVSWLGYVEVSAAVARAARERRIESAMRSRIEAQLDAEWSRSFQVAISEATFALVVELARRYSLTGVDSLHLAAAQIFTTQLMSLRNGDELIFWTSDIKLAREARSCGLAVKDTTQPTN